MKLKIYAWIPNIGKESEGNTFIEVTFSGANTPYSAYGRYYIRVHDEDRQIDNDALRNYYLSQKVDYSEWETASSGVSIKAADEKELKEYIKRGKEKGRINFDYSSRDKTLGRLGLLYDTKTLNNAGFILSTTLLPFLNPALLHILYTCIVVCRCNKMPGFRPY